MPRRAAANVTNDRGPRRFLFFSALSKPQGKYATRVLSDVVLLLGALRASAVKSDFLCVSASPRQRPAFHLGPTPIGRFRVTELQKIYFLSFPLLTNSNFRLHSPPRAIAESANATYTEKTTLRKTARCQPRQRRQIHRTSLRCRQSRLLPK